MPSDARVLELCGPCRHFEQALTGHHRCHLGLSLLDGTERITCDRFDPFPRGEGSLFEQSDCCRHAHTAGHDHGSSESAD